MISVQLTMINSGSVIKNIFRKLSIVHFPLSITMLFISTTLFAQHSTFHLVANTNPKISFTKDCMNDYRQITVTPGDTIIFSFMQAGIIASKTINDTALSDSLRKLITPVLIKKLHDYQGKVDCHDNDCNYVVTILTKKKATTLSEKLSAKCVERKTSLTELDILMPIMRRLYNTYSVK